MLLIGVLPLLFFGLISLINVNSTLKQQAIEYQTELIEQKAKLISHIISDVESLVTNLYGKDEIHRALTQAPEGSKIADILSGYTNLDGLISIDIFAENGEHYQSGENLYASDVNESLLLQLYQETAASNDDVYWSGIVDSIFNGSEHDKVLIASKLFKDNDNLHGDVSGAGILVISYDPAVFTAIEEHADNDTGFTIIFDAKKRVIGHPNKKYIGSNVSMSISEAIGEENSAFFQNVDGEDMLVVHYGIKNIKWTVASYIPVSSILSKTITINIAFAALLTIALLMIIFFGNIISRIIVQPIKKVIDTFRELRSGNLEYAERLSIKSKDEIGELGHLFNSFIDAREDITLQKKLERQLNKQNKELQQALEKLKNTQMQMLQQEKLAAIGQLAAGVAHEINNPLGYVSGNIDMLKMFLQRYENLLNKVNKMCMDADSQRIFDKSAYCSHIKQAWQDNKIDMVLENTQEMMDDITQGLRRIADIVNGLRGFSRNSLMEEKTMFDLNDGIKTTLIVVNNEIKYSCDVTFESGEVPPVYANGGQINQVLLNIILNAAHAIREKYERGSGKITIKTYYEADSVVCSICDNGCGMSEQVKNRIFEPFFTTKPVGQGTGLGLGIAYDIIVNQHGGSVKVQSEPGEGSCFYLSIPVSENEGKQ